MIECYTKTHQALNCKISPNTFQKIETIPNTFPEYAELKVELKSQQ